MSRVALMALSVLLQDTEMTPSVLITPIYYKLVTNKD